MVTSLIVLKLNPQSKETKEAVEIAQYMLLPKNTHAWMKDATEKMLAMQMPTMSEMFNMFKDLQSLSLTNEEQLRDQYVMLVQWATTELICTLKLK